MGDTMDAIGPMEVFSLALHDKKVKESKAFRVIFAGKEQNTMTAQNIPIRAHIDYDEAMKRIGEIDLLIVPGGGTDNKIKTNNQPMPLIKAFSELQKKNPSRERSLMSVCTGSLFLAEAGILSGLAATTHPDYVTMMEIICSNAAQRDMTDRCDVMEARYVVNNLRFELGENYEEDNPYVMSRKEYKEHQRRRSSVGVPTSPIEERANSGSGRRPSSVLKRANLRLGGLRVITCSGITSGIDGALYMVGAMVSDDSADEVARVMCHDWKKGVVVDGTDV